MYHGDCLVLTAPVSVNGNTFAAELKGKTIYLVDIVHGCIGSQVDCL